MTDSIETPLSDNVTWHSHSIDKAFRATQKKQRPCVLWFTGLSGAGKSTIASALEAQLAKLGAHTYCLDGDNMRHGLCGDLGFSPDDRRENVRRLGEVAKLLVDAGLIVLTASISPYRDDRQFTRQQLEDGEFIEIFVDTPLHVCEERDPKGLYKKARAGDIQQFTGIDAEYQPPLAPEIHLNAADNTIETLCLACLQHLKHNRIFL
ncbi:adenylyl-sulfate kinase [Vibrio aestuarianus]|uniref:Adenylyl-sulfate kinase n=1 Tax=Vibrio aestuarianus TaxID=28171 RepID=A0A9X4EY53_9VIBR|nr:adenylyl-sulfate kinase [Vibrio aestuarianus]MDE1240880.1 adenylyl-sulfate kinase [Vibrio aestuarianus]